ncbi:hypothetical protein TNCV_3694701 [Trichonephila clavipes]|nr:hypothetical protein TNCV_3694701 [Trichonephila clavipes]
MYSDIGHGSTLNSRPAASSFLKLVKGDERWKAPGHLQGVLPQNWEGTEPNRSVTCTVLRATVNDRHTSSPFPR